MDVLITGATGFIGSNLTEALLAGGARVHALVRDPRHLKHLAGMDVHILEGDLFRVPRLPADLKAVYHLAGLTKSLKPGSYYTVNRDGTASLMEAILRQGLRPRFVYLSSSAAARAVAGRGNAQGKRSAGAHIPLRKEQARRGSRGPGPKRPDARRGGPRRGGVRAARHRVRQVLQADQAGFPPPPRPQSDAFRPLFRQGPRPRPRGPGRPSGRGGRGFQPRRSRRLVHGGHRASGRRDPRPQAAPDRRPSSRSFGHRPGRRSLRPRDRAG